MKSLKQFKIENNVVNIEFYQSKGRAFAEVGNNKLLVSKSFDSSKEAFVTPLSTFNNGVDDTEGTTLVDNSFVICNSNAKLVFSL